ncbi:uncharacterized protein CIMG_10638 [Coccidioides immitis RS]|uniref:Uncharacterized protein n=4 Tax=Coccidioides immitis TaxID=5501 RepID=A0A0D8JSJ1_COCIM|nr:uncharacterized protein CIMG_10638 [Coccidioides immitis RS]KJF60247.1 hypothetical protein CIMG_10638 [Coccidioides immitis RS]KMP00806.1 hypothetical protein CIRG_00948 [Coccidioides immitis RMSCC 2394]KMU75538.1 hypothetical protein CISG_04941 [Coccidioides immitis RMSCC 3703]KMU85470.1 hypothetical protein CIHG_03252 [Coccidioides immitis H538.4]
MVKKEPFPSSSSPSRIHKLPLFVFRYVTRELVSPLVSPSSQVCATLTKEERISMALGHHSFEHSELITLSRVTIDRRKLKNAGTLCSFFFSHYIRFRILRFRPGQRERGSSRSLISSWEQS